MNLTGEKNAIQTVQVTSSDSVIQTNSRKQCQSTLSFIAIRGHMFLKQADPGKDKINCGQFEELLKFNYFVLCS